MESQKKKLTPAQYMKNQREAQARWRKNHARSIVFQFNIEKDADILQKLDCVSNKTEYIKRLIRADIIQNGYDD